MSLKRPKCRNLAKDFRILLHDKSIFDGFLDTQALEAINKQIERLKEGPSHFGMKTILITSLPHLRSGTH